MNDHFVESQMKTIATAILATCFSISSYAQMPPSPATSSNVMAKDNNKRDMHNAAHIKYLHEKLKITATEEPLWVDVANTMRENSDQIDQAIKDRETIIDTASAIEDLNAYANIAQAHADSVKKLAIAFGPLYAAMPDDQKKLADDLFIQRRHKEMKAKKLEK